MTNGSQYNQKYHPSAGRRIGPQRPCDLILTYLAGGYRAQVNVVSADILRQAQACRKSTGIWSSAWRAIPRSHRPEQSDTGTSSTARSYPSDNRRHMTNRDLSGAYTTYSTLHPRRPGHTYRRVLQGCQLKCGWCANPESQSTRDEIGFFATNAARAALVSLPATRALSIVAQKAALIARYARCAANAPMCALMTHTNCSANTRPAISFSSACFGIGRFIGNPAAASPRRAESPRCSWISSLDSSMP